MSSSRLLAIVSWKPDRKTRQFHIIRPLTVEEIENIETSTQVIRAHLQIEQLFEIVRLAFVAFGEFLGVRLLDAVSRRIGVDNINIVVADANRNIVNFLCAFRTYLDHSERRAKHDPDSTMAVRLKGLTSQFYDEVFSCRFMYKLRNFVQHCDMPIGHVRFIESSESDSAPMSFKHEGAGIGVFFDRDELLANFDGWSELVRNEISQLPKEIEAGEHISILYECITQIHKHIIERSRESIGSNTAFLHRLLDEAYAERPNGKPIIIDSLGADDRGLNSVQFEPLPTELLTTLAAAKTGGTRLKATGQV